MTYRYFSFDLNKYGIIEQELHDNYFEAIVQNIVSQQLSNKAADSINTRIHNQIGGEFTPGNIDSFGMDGLRGCGVSSNKAKYILEFATNINGGRFSLDSLESMTDDEVIAYLMTIKGVGRWTAEMIALFSLGRPNIFSYSDVALLNSILYFHDYKTLSKKRFESLRKKYSPYCSVASLYYYYSRFENSIHHTFGIFLRHCL